MLRSTFQLVTGVGPRRERRLWEAGAHAWEALRDDHESELPRAVLPRLRDAIAGMDRALAERDSEALAAALPSNERWRLFPEFADEALYLDIETDYEGITAIGLCDRRGPRILLAGEDLHRFPDEVRDARLLVTYNGLAFDVPVLKRSFPDWQAPTAHIDLCHVWRRLGHYGGLKVLEEREGLQRPDHLRGVDGSDAARLWHDACHGSREALRLFCEYNLYDTVNLRTLAALAYNRLVEEVPVPGLAPVPVSWRGDVLYDVSKELLRVSGAA